MRIISISIDLDPIWCYYDIHGIRGYENVGEEIIYTKALERIYEFFMRSGIKPTLFVVGRELNSNVVVSNLKDAVNMGYEIANHSLNHLYNLTLLSEEEIDNEIEGCDKIIFDKLGIRAEGFRAPGYNLCPYIIRVITNMEYKYDSSILPSPFYYFAKCAVIFLYKILGKKSKSICGSIKMPFAERKIYPMGNDIYWGARFSTILEIPISVAGFWGIPYIGTFIMGYREFIYNYLKKNTRRLNFLHIELHGLDFVDRNDIKDERLIKSQFDLSVPLEKKMERLKSLIDFFNPDNFMRLADFHLSDYIL